MTERPSYGTPAWFVGKRLMARVLGRDDSLVVQVGSEEDKQALIAEAPDVFWTTPHYDGYAAVLVRLTRVGTGELRELLTDAWRLRATPAIRRRHPEV